MTTPPSNNINCSTLLHAWSKRGDIRFGLTNQIIIGQGLIVEDLSVTPPPFPYGTDPPRKSGQPFRTSVPQSRSLWTSFPGTTLTGCLSLRPPLIRNATIFGLWRQLLATKNIIRLSNFHTYSFLFKQYKMLRPATPLTFLLFMAFVLLLISVISTPIVKGIPLASYEGVDFGVFGNCKGKTCTDIKVGYTTGTYYQHSFKTFHSE